MTNFTPVSAMLGGLLIGFASLLLVLLNGRVASISGIVGGAARASRDDLAWRGAFVLGLIAAPLAYVGIGGFVGFGTRLSNGCTSGHGVCGIARFRVHILEDSPAPTIFRSKAVGEPPLMLAISVWLALRDAVASLGDHRFRVMLDAPATPERLLAAVEEMRRGAAAAGAAPPQ